MKEHIKISIFLEKNITIIGKKKINATKTDSNSVVININYSSSHTQPDKQDVCDNDFLLRECRQSGKDTQEVI